MRIVYGSDLHLELQEKKNIPVPEGDICVLAGDIGSIAQMNPKKTDANSRKGASRMRKLFEELKHFSKVYYVPGNHEYYDSIFYGAIEKLQEFCSQYPNIVICNNYSEDIPGTNYNILLSTMWTDFNKGNPLVMYDAGYVMNDYNWIYNKEYPTYIDRHSALPKSQQNKITAQEILSEHNQSYLYLRNKLYWNSEENKRTILVTHHPLLLQSLRDGMIKNNSDYYFASDKPDLFLDFDIPFYIHGHTHHNVNYEFQYTRVLSNHAGYKQYESNCWAEFQWKTIDV